MSHRSPNSSCVGRGLGGARPEPDGAILVRILILSDNQRRCGSLKEALAELPNDTKIGLVGVRNTPRQSEFLDALSFGIQRAGAFEPGTHPHHPLRKKSTSP